MRWTGTPKAAFTNGERHSQGQIESSVLYPRTKEKTNLDPGLKMQVQMRMRSGQDNSACPAPVLKPDQTLRCLIEKFLFRVVTDNARKVKN